MSLRPDSVYRVDFRGLSVDCQPASGDAEDAGSPPKVLQIRLTEQALLQLASASAGAGAKVQINVSSAEPLLVIGDTSFPLHVPLPASGTQAWASSSSSSSNSPHELYRLSHDESTLQRVGTIATKFTVKPTRDVSAVAQRLKQQKEEEEHRKEERRKALMQGAHPQLTASASSRSSVNKNLANVKATNGLSLSSSPLSRSSSLNKLSSRRELRPQPSPQSTGISRETSPGTGVGSPAPSARLQGASYDAIPSVRRTERATTESPKLSNPTRPRSLSRLDDSDRSTVASSSGLRNELTRAEPRAKRSIEEIHQHEDVSPKRSVEFSSPASATSDLSGSTAKKSSKLTTRQRLAKATKAGSRLLAASASERRATPERRIASTPAHTSPPSNLGASQSTQASEAGKLASTDVKTGQATQATLLPRRDPVEASAGTHGNKTSLNAQESSKVQNRTRTLKEADGNQASAASSSSRPTREQPSAAPGKRKASVVPQNDLKADRETRALTSVSQKSLAERHEIASKSRGSEPPVVSVEGKRSTSRTHESDKKAYPASKRDSPPVKVVMMKRSRPVTDEALSTEKSATSRTLKDSSLQASRPEQPTRDDNLLRSGSSADTSSRSSSSSPNKQATARKATEHQEDTGQRKRRRTNDFASSEDASQRSNSGLSKPDDSSLNQSEVLPGGGISINRGDSFRKVPDHTSPQNGRLRGDMPQSTSMPSFAASSARLQSVAEIPDRIAKRPAASEYRDRRRDRSYDEDYNEAPRTHEEIPLKDDGDARQEPHSVDEDRKPFRETALALSHSNAPSAEAERPIKGVGPGATHWSEPWLDVRSRSDWHRLAQRFAKTQEEYLATRRRLEAESERLDREMELAAMEEQKMQALNKTVDGPTEQSLLFSPHNVAPPSSASDTASIVSGGGNPLLSEADIKSTSKTSSNLRSAVRSKAGVADDGDESPEEGEMRSSDAEEDKADSANVEHAERSHSGERSSGGRSPSTFDSILRDASRSESPDNITWRPSSAMEPRGASGDHVTSDVADRPLTYSDLANQVQKLSELHGSLSRMHRVLVDFKAKDVAVPGR